MAKRIKVGLIFSYKEGWIGGTYYILNLIYALKTIPDGAKPHLVIFSNADDFQKVKETAYPYLSFFSTQRKLSVGERVGNKIYRLFFRKNYFSLKPTSKDVDVLFPASNLNFYAEIRNKLFWIPDFQELYYPQFFSKEELANRMRMQKDITETKHPIIFSSQVAQRDYFKIFPDSKNKTHVLNFAVTHPAYEDLSSEPVLGKYNISEPFFMCPNQFWKHKNHEVVILACSLLKKEGFNFKLFFTGKEYDYRFPDYTESMKAKVADLGLNDTVYFLGFIDRSEQLKLMDLSVAIVQPSLFEGWSTVVEDAKALGKFTIASEIEVHKEQLRHFASFFNPEEPQKLAECMKNVLCDPVLESVNMDYTKSVSSFGEKFMDIIKESAKFKNY